MKIIDSIKTSNSKTNDDLVNGNLEELNITNQNKFRNVYAGIVQTNEMDFNTAKLICLTTGTKCVSGQNMSLAGLSLNDWYFSNFFIPNCLNIYIYIKISHAEILAIRLLRKYFYNQLKKLLKMLKNSNYNESMLKALNSETNIFELSENGNKLFRLKKNIKFHLFISSAPCGDARIFAVNDNGKLDSTTDK